MSDFLSVIPDDGVWVGKLTLVESERHKTVPFRVHLGFASFTMRMWADYHLLMEDQPEWFRSFMDLPGEKQQASLANWETSHQATYYLFLIRVVEIFSNRKLGALERVLAGPNAKDSMAGLDSICALATVIIRQLNSYQPTERQYFTHGGHLYKMPEVNRFTLGGLDQVEYGPNLTVGAVIEALQRAHVYGSKDEKGEPVVRDRRYHTDLATVASLSRRVIKKARGKKPEVLETVPLGLSEYTEFINGRIDELADLPASVGLDCNFFLVASGNRFVRTVMLRQPSFRQRSGIRRKRKGTLKRKKPHKDGAGSRLSIP